MDEDRSVPITDILTDELVARVQRAVWSAVRCRRDEAEDLVQDSLLRACKYSARVDPEKVVGYLVTVAKRVWYDHCAKRNRIPLSSDGAEILASLEASQLTRSFETVEDLEEQAAFHAALALLSPDDFCLLRAHCEGLTTKELATEFAISKRKVLRRLGDKLPKQLDALTEELLRGRAITSQREDWDSVQKRHFAMHARDYVIPSSYSLELWVGSGYSRHSHEDTRALGDCFLGVPVQSQFSGFNTRPMSFGNLSYRTPRRHVVVRMTDVDGNTWALPSQLATHSDGRARVEASVNRDIFPKKITREQSATQVPESECGSIRDGNEILRLIQPMLRNPNTWSSLRTLDETLEYEWGP